MRLRQKLVDLADSVKGLFGAKKQQDNAVERLERLKVMLSRGALHAAHGRLCFIISLVSH